MKKTTRVVVIAGIKGGIGKTTILLNLAINYISQGKKVLILDANIVQYSSFAFTTYRKEQYKDDLVCNIITEPNIANQLITNEERYSQYDYIFIDAGGTTDDYTRSAMIAASYGILLMPTQASIMDVWAMEDSLKILQKARKVIQNEIPAYALINMVPYKAKLITDTVEAIQAFQSPYNINLLNQTIGIRADFKNAMAQGKGVIEYAPKEKAAQEIKNLAKEINKIFNKISK